MLIFTPKILLPNLLAGGFFSQLSFGNGRTQGIIDRSKNLVQPAFVDDLEILAEMQDNLE